MALPGSLNANRRLSDWLCIHADGTITLRSGKVELGQGIGAALAQIVAEELDVSLARIRRAPASTSRGPNEGMTSGSLSVQDSGSALRQVCAEVRAIYLGEAEKKLTLTAGRAQELNVIDGTFYEQADTAGSAPAPVCTYWSLADDALLECDANGMATPKSPAEYRVVGHAATRPEVAMLVTGQARFIHDMQLPGMYYGRILHAPSSGAVLCTVDVATVQALEGVVKVVRDGHFLGVVARTELAAQHALKKLAALAEWTETSALPDLADLTNYLRSQPCETTLVGEKQPAKQEAPPDGTQPPVAAHNFQASYSRPFLAHASIGPSCAVARYQPGELEVWTHSQGIFHLRADLAVVFELPLNCITVQHVEGAGCYGHNGADDVACDAALLARAVPGHPVHVVWTREDELGCAPLGPAMAVQVKASVTADGQVVDWQHEVWSTGHSMRPGRSAVPVLLAATTLAKPHPNQVAINAPLAAGGGAERNAVPLYNFEKWRAVSHRVLTMPIRTSALRSLGAHCNVFALESFLDEIALAQKADPLEFRLRHLSDPRARSVLEQVATMAGWSSRTNPDRQKTGQGLGLAFARYKNTGAYCAVVAAVDASGHELRATRLWIAVDVGLVINPDGVLNQIEGGAIQTVSWVLKEAVQFDRTRILSTTWDQYPILKFSEVPAVEVHIIDRPDQKSVGAGEATHGPVAAAIANALADGLGVRVRDMPFTPAQIERAAMATD